MQVLSCDFAHAESDIKRTFGRPGQHSASPGAQRPDKHAGGPVRGEPESCVRHPLSLLPAPAPPEPSPGPRFWPGSR